MSKTQDGSGSADSIDEATFVSGTTVAHMKATPGGTEYNFNLPDNAGTVGGFLTSGGGGSNEMVWTVPGFGTGSVTSVAATVPPFMNISGTPITTSGTLGFGLSGVPLPVVNGGTGVNTSTGSGANVLANAPTMGTVTMNALVLTNPLGVGQGGTGVTTSTGTGSTVLSINPTINGPSLISPTVTGTTLSPGNINVTNATQSTSSTTGAITVAGGIGIVGNLNVGGTITGTAQVASINTPGTITTTNTTDSTSTTTGSITTAGGIGVAKATNIGSFLSINKSGTGGAENHLRISSSTPNGRASIQLFENTNETGGNWRIGFNISGVSGIFDLLNYNALGSLIQSNNVNGNINIVKQLSVADATDSTSTTTGSITTAGGLGVAKNITAGADLVIRGTTFMGGPGNLTSTSLKIAPISASGKSVITNYATNSFGSANFWEIGQQNSDVGLYSFYSSARGGIVSKWAPAGPVAMEVLTGHISIEPGFGITTNSGTDIFTYSTGLWTPTLDGSVSYTTQTGKYVQSGIEVKVAIRIIFDVLVSGTALKITNLPFTTAASGGIGFGIIGQGGMTGIGSVLVARGTDSTTDLEFFNPLDELPIILDNTWPTVTIEGLVTYFV